MDGIVDAFSILHFHDGKLDTPGWPFVHEVIQEAVRPAGDAGTPWHWIEENHRYNSMLWEEEDKARRTDVEATQIAECKRRIDRYNQRRNDAVEALDETILAALAGVDPLPDARQNSETAGSMIDRMSILSLKIFHMREQTERPDASNEHVAACSARLQRLREQREDLARCLTTLLADARRGTAYFKVYRQFKMYNDPALNPYLYKSQKSALLHRARQ